MRLVHSTFSVINEHGYNPYDSHSTISRIYAHRFTFNWLYRLGTEFFSVE